MSGWARNRFEQYRDKASATMPELDEYDREIVDSTLELRDELKIPETKYNPYRVEWLDKLPGQEKSELGVYSTDFLTMDSSLITLQKDLKEKLGPDDWRALIASQLEYRFVTQRPFRMKVFYRSAIPAGFVVAAFFALTFFLTLAIGRLGPGWATGFPGQLFAFLLALVVFVRGLPYRK